MTNKPYHARKDFRWQFNKKIVLFVLLTFPCLVSLGFWQLSRAEEKRVIKELYNQNFDVSIIQEDEDNGKTSSALGSLGLKPKPAI